MKTRSWIDGRWVEPGGDTVPVLSHALHYGSGVFEGIRAYGGRLFRLGAHVERFRRGCEALGLALDFDALSAACVEAARPLGDAYVRPIAFHGEGGLGLDVGRQRVHVDVIAMEWNSHLGRDAGEHGVRMMRSTWRRTPARSIPPLKLTGAYVNSVLAKREAAQAGFDEALFVDERGFVCEATGENVFAVIDGELVAVRHADALPGITREAVRGLTGAPEREMTYLDLLRADEIFLTGTSAEVTPVRELDARRLGVGPVTRRVQERYQDAVRGGRVTA